MQASLAARTMSASSTVASQSVRLSQTVPSNREISWSTTANEFVITRLDQSRRGRPSNSTSPLQGSYRPQTSLAIVVLPLPEPPTRATRLPGGSDRLNFSTSGGSSGP